SQSAVRNRRCAPARAPAPAPGRAAAQTRTPNAAATSPAFAGAVFSTLRGPLLPLKAQGAYELSRRTRWHPLAGGAKLSDGCGSLGLWVIRLVAGVIIPLHS